ncbi:NHLP leader peptide family RiPP precursor [Cohnella luojiensis]|uniref:NHLP leader peptide family natural product n=1 Tax=Cohnella luojiensis TaxID=652876 RepID=A0A4Y8LPT7_9BACL|nr:NHLP leader peptide family RiPP precursor [Cohnella luojiensis]TFE19592.1 NHLP leader peptide family natural product precursor [Cohnella luojiensis]
MSVESLKIQIIKKAWEDDSFKQNLLIKPKKAIKEAFGVDIPDGIELKVVEESPSLYYLTLPPKPEDVADGESSPNIVW